MFGRALQPPGLCLSISEQTHDFKQGFHEQGLPVEHACVAWLQPAPA